MKLNRDILQKIASLCDDNTARNLLLSDKRLDNDTYFHLTFGTRYPNLIHYIRGEESLKEMYMRNLPNIHAINKYYEYVSGDPQVQFNLLNLYENYEKYIKDKLNSLIFSLEKSNIISRISKEAVKYESLEILKYFENKLFDEMDYFQTILRNSCREGKTEIVKYALENGADPSYADNICLIEACQRGNIGIVQLLIEFGMDIHFDQDYVLIAAIESGSDENKKLEMVNYLLNLGLNVNARNGDPLSAAIINHDLGMIKFLVENGAHVDEDILKAAEKCKQSEILNYLKSLTL